VIENDLDHPWMITGNISDPLQLEMINTIVFFPHLFFDIHGQPNHQKLEETMCWAKYGKQEY
jgi:hypothetical protein